MPGKSESPGSPSLRRRKTEESENAANGVDADDSSKFTSEQLQAIEQIRKCKDYYEILGVTKEANESDLRKQYKRLALQFHPDKNKAPGAVEAFKAVGNAFAVLSDPAKRKRYDAYGLDAMQTGENNLGRETYYGYSNSFEGDISAEDLYNMFFQGSTTYVRRGNQWQRFHATQTHYHEQTEARSTLLQILPLIFIVSVSLLSSYFVVDPPFSLQRTTKYLYERRTASLDVPYYVRDNFLRNYEQDLQKIERQVEEDYIINVRSSCFRERNYKENMIWRAKHFKDISLEIKAKELRTPSCDTLNELHKIYNRI